MRGDLIVHPQATEPGVGLAPGVDVTIHVLKLARAPSRSAATVTKLSPAFAARVRCLLEDA